MLLLYNPVTPYYTLFYHTLSSHLMSCSVLSYHFLPYRALLSCSILSYPVLSYLILSYPILPWYIIPLTFLLFTSLSLSPTDQSNCIYILHYTILYYIMFKDRIYCNKSARGIINIASAFPIWKLSMFSYFYFWLS